MPWCDFSKSGAIDFTAFCRNHFGLALALSNKAMSSRVLALRVQKYHIVSQSEYNDWDDAYAYAGAMRKVHSDFPDNQDAMALFVEVMMTRTPCRLWDVKTGLPTVGVDTSEAIWNAPEVAHVLCQ